MSNHDSGEVQTWPLTVIGRHELHSARPDKMIKRVIGITIFALSLFVIASFYLLAGHPGVAVTHYGSPVRYAYDYAANPCAPHHPPVSPDAGACRTAPDGTQVFIAS